MHYFGDSLFDYLHMNRDIPFLSKFLLLGFPDTGPLVMLGPEGQICALEVLNIAINIANDIFIVVFISDLC